MITQLANKKLECIQLLLGIILFCIFISYSLNHAFPMYSTYIIIAYSNSSRCSINSNATNDAKQNICKTLFCLESK